MNITVNAFVEFGRCDATNWDCSVSLTDEEYALLKEYLHKSITEDIDLDEIESLTPIRESIYQQVVDQATDDSRYNDYESIEEYIEDAVETGQISSEEEWRIDMIYQVGFQWPDHELE